MTNAQDAIIYRRPPLKNSRSTKNPSRLSQSLIIHTSCKKDVLAGDDSAYDKNNITGKNNRKSSIKTRRSQSLKIFTKPLVSADLTTIDNDNNNNNNNNSSNNENSKKEFFSFSVGNEKAMSVKLKNNFLSLPSSQINTTCNANSDKTINTGN